MLVLRAFLGQNVTPRAPIRDCYDSLPNGVRALFKAGLETQASLLRTTLEKVYGSPRESLRYRYNERIEDAEIFTDGAALIAVQLEHDIAARARSRPPDKSSDEPLSIWLFYIGQSPLPPLLNEFVTLTSRAFGCELSPVTFPSSRFSELKAEGRELPVPPTEAERAASLLLADKATRQLA